MKRRNLPETNNIAPENGWLEDVFPSGARPIFRCELLVSGTVTCNIHNLATLIAMLIPIPNTKKMGKKHPQDSIKTTPWKMSGWNP